MTEFENIDHVVEERAIKGEDPYRLKDYQSDVIPPDGGHAPLPKTAEPEAYHDNRLLFLLWKLVEFTGYMLAIFHSPSRMKI